MSADLRQRKGELPLAFSRRHTDRSAGRWKGSPVSLPIRQALDN